ncbi:MAG: cbb3-type cytochrome c oxidase N-terminal domain-containing protein [Chitinophagales bacterium]
MRSRQFFILMMALIVAAPVWGQSAAAAATAKADGVTEFSHIMTWVLVTAASLMVVLGIVYMLWVNKFMYQRILKLEAQKAGLSLPEEIAELEGEDFWTKFRKKYWEDAVPIEREGEILSHHDFDGIRELDNSLPPWWVNMFIVTIIWSVGYLYYYHFGGNGPSQEQEYNKEVETARKEIAMALAGQANKVDESSVTLITDASALSQGEVVFNANCAACHGKALEGGVGPNLTDEHWIHGGGVKNVFKTIKYGVPEKGMIAWQAQIGPGDMQKLSSYIISKAGSNPPNAKAPQGEKWVEAAAADTTSTATPATGK